MPRSTTRASYRAAALCGAATLLLAATPAWAQPAADAAPAASEGDIIVTAQRRDERLVDVPMSIVAVTAETVEKSGVISVHDINRLAPGVQINFAGCCTQPAIRGISTLTTGVGFENNVAIYVDGFYSPDNLSINGDLGNLESIEILKGPQGTLWGRNATGGAILMNTKAPSHTFTGKGEIGYARFNELSVSGYLSGPLSDGVRASISSYSRKSDGYYDLLDNTGKVVGHAAPIEQGSIRAKVEFDLGANTTATFGANYGLASDPRGSVFTVLQYPSPLLPVPPARADKPRTSSSTQPSISRAKVYEGTLKLVHNAEFGRISSYTGYALRKTTLGYDFDGSTADLIYSAAHWRQKTFQQTLDVNVTAIDGANIVIGGTYYHDYLESLDQLGFGSFSGNGRSESRLTAESLAGYVDASVNLTDALTFDVGARYTHETKRVQYSRFNRITNVATQPDLDKSAAFNAFTPKASLRYEIAPRTNVYASISRGFRSGGFNPNGATSAAVFLPFSPEKITAYEIGFKTSSPRVQFETAAFYYDFRDLQLGVTVNVPGFGLVNKVINAPKAEVYGIDALVSAELVENLKARVGLAYLHGRYGTFTGATGTGLNSTTQTNITNQPQDWTGQQMARSPSFSGNVALDYTVEGVAGGKLNLGSNVQFTSSFVTNNPSLYGPLATAALQNQQRFRQGAYATVNAQVSWTDADDRYKITAYVNNATDTDYRQSYNGSFTGDYAVYSQPLTWGARFGVQF